MNIIDAVRTAKLDRSYITRKAWDYPYRYSGNWSASSIKLMPTDSPDGFVLHSANAPDKPGKWYPRMEDILAEDWFIVQA